jgi:hypothetical protein
MLKQSTYPFDPVMVYGMLENLVGEQLGLERCMKRCLNQPDHNRNAKKRHFGTRITEMLPRIKHQVAL